MPTTIRRATPADATQAAEVFVASRATMTYLPKLHTDDETRAFIRETVGEKETWIAEREGRVVGFAVIDGGWLEHLYVHPSRFNSETGSKLFTQITGSHPQGFQLWVFQQNAGARRFYEAMGFVTARRWMSLELDRPASAGLGAEETRLNRKTSGMPASASRPNR